MPLRELEEEDGAGDIGVVTGACRGMGVLIGSGASVGITVGVGVGVSLKSNGKFFCLLRVDDPFICYIAGFLDNQVGRIVDTFRAYLETP